MMSKTQWFVLLCLFIIYLLLGAAVFYIDESNAELKRAILEKEEQRVIESLLLNHYTPGPESSQDQIFEKLTNYCGKPMRSNMSSSDIPLRWDFYHSLFFVITVVSTIGYGNLAPTTMFGRIFMIFYGLVGIPINGIVMVTLAEFFGKKFTKLYKGWKRSKIRDFTTRLGLVGQISLYLIPGFTFFIFLPSVIIMVFEGWDYDVAVYYSFVTLTTIGFGDYVAGVNDNGFGEYLFTFYKIFLLVWIIIGLGYILMVLGFITRGMKSKKMHAIEHMLAENFKRTPDRFRALKSLIHEIVLLKVKPVYKKKSIFVPVYNGTRSQSCPNLTMYDNTTSPRFCRKRAFSESVELTEHKLHRVHSDTNLELIDKDLTFDSPSEHTEFLLQVSNFLSKYESAHNQSCRDLANSLSSDLSKKTNIRPKCKSVSSDDVFNNDSTWYGQSATIKRQELQEQIKHGRARSRTLPVQQEPLVRIPQRSIFSRLRKTFVPKSNSQKDIEKQDIYSSTTNKFNVMSETERYLSKTRHGRPSTFSLREPSSAMSLAELLLALTEDETQNKNQNCSCTPPDSSPLRSRRPAIKPINSRRSSMIPVKCNKPALRRFSLRPAEPEAPPPYSLNESRPRRYSLRPISSITTSPSPVQRQRMKSNKEQIVEGEVKKM